MARRRHLGRMAITALAFAVLAFMLMPVLIIAIYAFSDSSVQVWPIAEFSLDAFPKAWG